MGLLDDAIREHLELKRQRGADPGEVAREEHEALDVPVDGASADDVTLAGEAASAAPLVDPPSAPAPPVAAVPVDAGAGVAPQPSPDDPSDMAVGGETAELDMSSVLGDEQDDA